MGIKLAWDLCFQTLCIFSIGTPKEGSVILPFIFEGADKITESLEETVWEQSIKW